MSASEAVQASWRNPARPSFATLLGLTLRLRTEKLAVAQWLSEHVGPVAMLPFPLTPIVVVADPQIALTVLRDQENFPEKGIGLRETKHFLGEGLLSATTGEKWKRSRAALGKLFSLQNVPHVAAVAADVADGEIDMLRHAMGPSGTTDVYPALERIALRTIGGSLFGPAFDKVAAAVQADLRALSQWAEGRIALPIDRLTALSWICNPALRGARSRLFENVDWLCARASRTAFLREEMTGEEIRSQVVTILLAGYETTAAATAWALMLLAQDDSAYEAVATEGEAPVHEAGGGRAYPATTAVVKEAMRLYPPVWAITRRVKNPAVIHGYAFAGGCGVLLNVFGIHRNPALWDRADEFVPARFRSGKPDPEFFLPFGAGMRRCIGLHLGLAQACALAARFCAHFRPAASQARPRSGLTLRPDSPVLMKTRR